MLRVTDRVVWMLEVLNRIFMAVFVLVLLATALAGEWLRSRIGAPASLDAGTVIAAVRLVMLLGLATGVAVSTIFRRLREIFAAVRAGDAFAPVNGVRLRHIAWALLAIQLLDLALGAVAAFVERAAGMPLGWSFTLTGWLAVLLIFVLAEVWTQGAAMRDELEGTV